MIKTDKLYWNIPDSYYDEPYSGRYSHDEEEEEEDDADYEFLHADARIEDRED